MIKLLSLLSLFALLQANAAVELKPYGILKSTVVSSSKKVVSFSANNHTAVTHAARVDTTTVAQRNFDESRRTSFQAQQSRLGLKLSSGEHISGKVEIDFIDFAQSTHGVGNQTRIRLLQFDYKFSDNFSFSAGQKWLTFLGVLPHTYNLVQASYYSGNTGFIGQEMAIKYNFGSLSAYAAIGARGKNTASDNDAAELGLLPSGTLRLDYNFSHGLFGIAMIAAEIENKKLSTDTNDTFKDATAYAGKAFSHLTFGSFDLRLEGFFGKNTEDLALLALSGGSYDTSTNKSIKTIGGFISLKFNINDSHSVYGSYGLAKHQDAEKYLATDSLATNNLARVGYDYNCQNGLHLIAELSQYDTEYVTAAGGKKDFDANVAEAGLVYKF